MVFCIQIWDTIQAFCSSINGTLATHAVLKGSGVGDEAASVASATITWLLKGKVYNYIKPSRPSNVQLGYIFFQMVLVWSAELHLHILKGRYIYKSSKESGLINYFCVEPVWTTKQKVTGYSRMFLMIQQFVFNSYHLFYLENTSQL